MIYLVLCEVALLAVGEGFVLYKLAWPFIFPAQLWLLLQAYPPGWTRPLRGLPRNAAAADGVRISP